VKSGSVLKWGLLPVFYLLGAVLGIFLSMGVFYLISNITSLGGTKGRLALSFVLITFFSSFLSTFMGTWIAPKMKLFVWLLLSIITLMLLFFQFYGLNHPNGQPILPELISTASLSCLLSGLSFYFYIKHKRRLAG